jgi:hypothetical protein
MGCETRQQQCRVSVVGHRTIVGPTPINAPYLSSELADRLLDELPPWLPGATVRFEYHTDFFTFSWELHAPLIARLARLGAGLEFCVNTSRADFDSFVPTFAQAELLLWTDDRDPGEVTERIGIEPSEVRRAGDPIGKGPRRVQRSSWRHRIETETDPDVDTLAATLCDELPAPTADVCRDHAGCFRIVLQVEYDTGGFTIAPDTVARIADLGLPLGCWLFPG